MLTRPQQIILKRAQRQAGVDDAEYRQTLAQLTGCTSSKDPGMADEDLDVLLSYFEAVYWRGVDLGRLQPPCNRSEVFQQRGYWAAKNTKAESSRDRFNSASLQGQIEAMERNLGQLGFGLAYCQSIRSKVTNGRRDMTSLRHYVSALQRTLRSKQKPTVEEPF